MVKRKIRRNPRQDKEHMTTKPQPTTMEERFVNQFGAFAILGGERFYNGAFANEARITEALDFLRQEIEAAVEKERERCLDDMFLEIAKLAEPDERQPSAGDLHTNMDEIYIIRDKIKGGI
jgi:hypothetical protein